jgi:hypothetical protein
LFRPRWLLATALLISFPWTIPWMDRHLPDLSPWGEYRCETREITINKPPHWVPHNLVEQVVVRAKLPPTVSVLEEDLTERVARAFAAHPWVEQVIQVRKTSFPARIEARLRYREPVALVEKRTGFYPVSGEGILLPPEDFSLAETAGYLKILGVRSSPFQQVGEQWNDPLVLAASRLATILKHDWKPLNLKAVQVPVRASDDIELDSVVLTLVSRGGSRIVWGAAPGVSVPDELDSERKLEQLRQYFTDFGSFERPSGPYEIDIRYDNQISRSKLASPEDVRRPPSFPLR